MIDFGRAFNSAWERMVVILFRPFDLGKWCVIGFSAFLAGLLSGGNGFNSSYNSNTSHQDQRHTGLYHHHSGLFAQESLPNPFNLGPSPQSVATQVNHLFASYQTGVLYLLILGIFFFVLGIILLFYWLGARGQFLLLDNIVRNRGAIAAPWTFYARPANRVFGLLLICGLIGLLIMVALAVPALLIMWPLFSAAGAHNWPAGGLLAIVAGLVLAYLAFALVYFCAFFLFREWGIALMFRNGLTARAALLETWKLVCLRPGSTALFLLLRLALFIGIVVLSVLACCFTCCVAALPYIGTVVLLPALIYIRCFSLDCLAQFGPEYDVFTVDVPPIAPFAPISPLPPPV
jgi:hypothetical protein